MPTDLIALLAVNILALILMGLDKHRARTGQHRVPERVLWASALAGGVFGAWLAMRLFRHKARKASFRWRLGAASVLGVAGWSWWLATRYL